MNTPRRVFAVLNATEKTVFLLGKGTLVGDEVPPPEVKFCGLPMRKPNPKIVLESGKVVWGCECWHGPIEKFEEFCKGRTVMHCDIDRARANAFDSSNNFDPED